MPNFSQMVRVSGVLTTLHGQPLSGTAAHYVFLKYADYRVSIDQPRGDDGPLTLPRPAGWTDDGRIHAAAVTTAGVQIDRTVTLQGGMMQVNYVASISGQSVQRFVLTYCRVGDADCDGGIGASDFQSLGGCVMGPDAAAGQACRTNFDADADSDVDVRDVAAFQVAYDGGG